MTANLDNRFDVDGKAGFRTFARPARLLKAGGPRVFMSASTALRIASSVTVFLIVARVLGPASYGFFAITFTYATLVSLVTDYGFATQIPQKIGAEPERGGEFLGQALRGKTLLTGLAAILVIAGLAASGLNRDNVLVICVIGASVLLNAYADLMLTGLRSAGGYAEEAVELAFSWIVVVLLLVVAIFFEAEILGISATLLAARAIHVAAALWVVRRAGFRLAGWWRGPLGLASGTPYAADSLLSVLTSQIDVILVSRLFTLEDTGIYQIGSRLVQGAISLSAALTGIHLPRGGFLRVRDPRAYAMYERRIIAEFSLFGVLMATSLAIGGHAVVDLLLGPAYARANELWPGLAAFLFMRFLAAAVGVCFLVRGLVRMRIGAQFVCLAVTVTLILFPGRFFGLAGVSWALAAGAAAAVLWYGACYIGLRRAVSTRTKPSAAG